MWVTKAEFIITSFKIAVSLDVRHCSLVDMYQYVFFSALRTEAACASETLVSVY
jgi:hypothetical protein